jgi:Sulfotransferase family
VIVIGLGTGRSGTASLAKLLSAQRDAFCFHEMNPACVRFSGTPRPILNAIDEYQAILDSGDPSMLTVDLSRPLVAKAYDELCKMPRLRLIGDIAFYYLTYVEAIAARNPNVRFLCMRRDIDETVASWMKKLRVNRWPSKHLADRLGSLITRAPFYKSSNPFMNHDGTEWEIDPVWDKCFPKFEAVTMPEAVSKYCEFYYTEAESLAARLAPVFRFVETARMNDRDYQVGVLDFVGVPERERIYTVAHINRSESDGAESAAVVQPPRQPAHG